MFFNSIPFTEESIAEFTDSAVLAVGLGSYIDVDVFQALKNLRDASKIAIARKKFEEEMLGKEKTLEIPCSQAGYDTLEFEIEDGKLRIEHSDGDWVATDKEGAKKIIKFLQEYVDDKAEEVSDKKKVFSIFWELELECEISRDTILVKHLPRNFAVARTCVRIKNGERIHSVILSKEKIICLRDHLSEVIKRI